MPVVWSLLSASRLDPWEVSGPWEARHLLTFAADCTERTLAYPAAWDFYAIARPRDVIFEIRRCAVDDQTVEQLEASDAFFKQVLEVWGSGVFDYGEDDHYAVDEDVVARLDVRACAQAAARCGIQIARSEAGRPAWRTVWRAAGFVENSAYISALNSLRKDGPEGDLARATHREATLAMNRASRAAYRSEHKWQLGRFKEIVEAPAAPTLR